MSRGKPRQEVVDDLLNDDAAVDVLVLAMKGMSNICIRRVMKLEDDLFINNTLRKARITRKYYRDGLSPFSRSVINHTRNDTVQSMGALTRDMEKMMRRAE